MLLRPLDVKFPKIPLEGRSSGGTPYTRWVPCGMPHLVGKYASILKAVFFLYPDRTSAKQGIKSGGTGFLIAKPMERIPGRVHIHAVTNWHVAVCATDGPPSPVIRINRKSGKTDIFELDCTEWIFRGGGPDIAISPPLTVTDDHDLALLDIPSWLLTQEDEITDQVGPGDDVFMIGRFVDYDGVETNQPAARFGHVSMMDSRIKQSNNYRGRSIVLDMHSRTGFSGSPVFVYRTIGSHFFDPAPGQFLRGGGHYIKLLGIHYAQFPELWELKAKKGQAVTSTQATLSGDTHYIEGLSGMTCVIPASDILELFNHPELATMRERDEQRCEGLGLGISKGPKSEPAGLKSEKAVPPANDVNPTHREDFTNLLSAAARKPEPKD